MVRPETVKPYHGEGPKGEQVEAMFDSIAPAYDFMNTAMTFGLHKRWLCKAIDALGHPGEIREILDLATGTGEVAFRLATLFPEANILGVDLSEGMLDIARKKLARKTDGKTGKIKFQQGDCLRLDLPDHSFDLLTIAYGVRNFENLEKGFKEFHRVLKPGGQCLILELSRPENPLIRAGYDLYSRTLVPLAGRMISRDTRAYSYLPESIAAMPPRKKIAEMLRDTGFSEVKFKSLTLGVVTFYISTY